MDLSTAGVRLPNPRFESRRGLERSLSEHFDGTICDVLIDHYQVNLLSDLRDDLFYSSLVEGSGVIRLFGPITLSTLVSFNKIRSM